MEDFTQEFTQGKSKEAMKAAGASSADLYMIHPDNIFTKEGFNIRVQNEAHEAKILWLMESIRNNGFDRTKPLPGYVALEGGEHRVYAIGGHRRLEAVRRLMDEGFAIEAIPMILKPRGTSMEDLTVDLYLDNETDPVDLYGQSILVKRLQGYGTPISRIAERMNMSVTKVNDLLQLAAAPSALRQLVIEGKVSGSLAIETIEKYGDKALDKLLAGLEKTTNGKVTAKLLDDPHKVFTKKIKKEAPEMYNVLGAVMDEITEGGAVTNDTFIKLKELIAKLQP